MKSKILVENDFDINKPYFQLILDSVVPPDQQSDMRDTCLKRFVEMASKFGVEVYWPLNGDTNSPQLRIMESETTTSFYAPIDWSKEIEINHVKINAKRKQSYGEDSFYKNGESYNLMFSTADNNCIIIKYGGAIVTNQDTFWRYESLSQFLEYWTVNQVKS